MHSTLSLLLALLLAPTALVALPTAMPSFDDVLALSPRDLVPSYASAPKPLQKRIDYFPAFTSPTQGSSWQAGGELTVGWNNTLPPYASNQIHYAAVIYLGYLDDSSPGYNLDVDHPLANVSLYNSTDPIQVTLPADLETRSTYLLVMGSTSNMSPLFTVNAVSAAASSSSTSSTSANPSTTHVAPSSMTSSSTTAVPLSTRTTLYLANGDSTVLGSSSATTTTTPASSAASISSSSTSESAGPVAVPVASPSSSPLPSSASASAAPSSSSSSTSASTSTSASASTPTVASPAVAAASASATKTSGATTTSQIGGTTLLLAGVVAAAIAL
ncbi:hypothetical protein JCM5296_004160 [Sporobolomyces johnsonii]